MGRGGGGVLREWHRTTRRRHLLAIGFFFPSHIGVFIASLFPLRGLLLHPRAYVSHAFVVHRRSRFDPPPLHPRESLPQRYAATPLRVSPSTERGKKLTRCLSVRHRTHVLAVLVRAPVLNKATQRETSKSRVRVSKNGAPARAPISSHASPCSRSTSDPSACSTPLSGVGYTFIATEEDAKVRVPYLSSTSVHG